MPITVHQIEDGQVNQTQFESYVDASSRMPFVLRGVQIGACCKQWTPEYISAKGSHDIAVAHVSPSAQMDFIQKNFTYKKMPFRELVHRAAGLISEKVLDGVDEEHYYFRSLGENVRKDPSNFHKQFTELAKDLSVPKVFAPEKFFSSIFRMSSTGVQLWTHYDIMDNILIEVRGRKRVVMFAPDQALNIYLKGDKSLVTDIDNPDLNIFPKFAQVRRYECFLEAGDILFIPALWFHNVTAIDFCVAVNIFWKNLDESLYDHKDVYGNKDLNPAFRCQDMINRACKLLDDLPIQYKDFYARKLIQSIKDKCSIAD